MKDKIDKLTYEKLLVKIAKWFTVVLFILIPVTGLVLESFHIFFISFDIIFGFYILTIIISLIAKQWKLALIATFGSLIIYAITLGLSEVLWYYLKELYNIDISPQR